MALSDILKSGLAAVNAATGGAAKGGGSSGKSGGSSGSTGKTGSGSGKKSGSSAKTSSGSRKTDSGKTGTTKTGTERNGRKSNSEDQRRGIQIEEYSLKGGGNEPSTQFSDAANAGQGNAQQEGQSQQGQYTTEANADDDGFVDLFAQDDAKQAEQQRLRQAAQDADAEVERLRQEGQTNSAIWVDGVYLGEDKATADAYSKQIAEAQEKADKAWEAAGGRDKNWLEKAQDLMAQGREEAAAGSDFSEGDENVHKAVKSWAQGRAAGVIANIGAFVQSAAQDGKNQLWNESIDWEQVEKDTKAGQQMMNAAAGLRNESEQNWETATENLTGGERLAANVAKTGADVVADFYENMAAPGLGTMRMYMGAGGNAALDQMGRENNDADSVAIASMKSMLSAWLSTRLVGGMESVYGKSVLGGFTDKMLGNASPAVQRTVKTLLNTEGIEEGLENILNYAGDRILGLDTGAALDWDEIKQDALVGYILGVVTNGMAGGMNIDSKKQAAIAEEAVEFAESGLTIDEAAEIAKESTKDQVVMKPGAVETEAEAAPATEAPAAQPAQTAQQTNLVETEGWTWNNWMTDTLSKGALNDEDIDYIVSRNAARQAFEEVTGISLDGMSEEEARATIAMAAGSTAVEGEAYVPDQTGTGTAEPATGEPTAPEGNPEATTDTENTQPPQNLPPQTEAVAPDAATTLAETATGQNFAADAVAEIMSNPMGEDGKLTERQARMIANNPALRAAFAEMAGIADQNIDAQAVLDIGNDMLPGFAQADSNAPEVQEGTGSTTTPPNAENATEGNLNASGTNQRGNVPGAPSAPGQGPVRNSQTDQHVINRLEGEGARDPRTYLRKSDLETLQGALNRLNMNGDAETEVLMTTEMWNDEQVQMANMILDSLFADQQASGDSTAYDAFAAVYAEHGKQVARALRQFGRPGAGSVRELADLAKRHIDMMRAQTDADLRSGKNPKLTHEQIDAIEQTTNDNITKLSGLEAREAEMRKSGASEEAIWNATKDQWLDTAQELVAQRYMGLLVDDILGKNEDLRAKDAETRTILRKILEGETPEYIRQYVKGNTAGLETDIEYMGIPTAKQAASMVNSFHKMCMLFSSGTAGRNMVSNIFLGTFDWAANNAGGAPADVLLSLFTGHRSRGMEAGALGRDGWSAAGTAVRRSILEIAANMDMNEDGKYINGTSAFSPYNPFTRVFARANQILSYALNTTDAFSAGMAKGSAESAAYRVGAESGMTQETAEKIGQNEADFRTLKDKNVVTEKLNELHQALDLIGFGGEVIYKDVGGRKIPIGRKGGYGLGSFEVPFVSVPVNLKLKALQYSPANIVYGAVQAKQATDLARNSPKNSDAYQESYILQNEASGRIGRGLTGTAVLMLLSSLMKKAKEEGKEWFKDWDQETDPNVKAQNRAEGKSGQQINTRLFNEVVLGNGEESDGTWKKDDRTVDISSIEPMDQFLAMASMMADDENASTPEAYMNALQTSTEESLTDMPCLQALNDFSDTLNNNPVYDVVQKVDDEGNVTEERVVNKAKTRRNALGAAVGSAASGFIPAPLRHYAQVRDEYQRDTTGDNAVETAINRLKLAIPGKRETLPIKTDAYGRPLTQGDETTRKLNTYSPFKFSQIDQSETSAEVQRLREATGTDLTPDRYGPKSFTYGSGKNKQTVNLSNTESTDLKNQRGRDYDQAMQELMDNPVYQLADDDTKLAMAKEMLSYANDGIKTDVAEKNGIEHDSRFAEVRDLDDPTVVLATKTGLNNAKKEEDWDAVDALLRAARGSEGVSEAGMDYLTGKDSKLNYYSYLQDKGVEIGRAEAFAKDMEELYTSEKRTDPRGEDYIRTACSGRYTEAEADAIMGYVRDVSKEATERYQSQIQYQLQQGKASGKYETIMNWVDKVQNGEKTMDDFRTWIRNSDKSGIPLKQANQIAEVLSTWTSDRHAVGKTVAGIYEAAREVGYTPEQALIFFEHIDKNFNGSYPKTELDAAVAWALGYDKTYTRRYYGKTYRYYTFSGNALKLRNLLREKTGK